MATKNIKRDALRVLREFQIAGELSTAADMHACRESTPRPTSRLLSVVFMKTQYVILIDNTIEDDVATAIEVIHQQYPSLDGNILKNPHESDFETFGLRHKFRETYIYEVAPRTVRLDKELSRRYPDLSRATIQKYIKAGYVRVDGEPATKSSKDVATIDEISLSLPAKQDFSKQELPIIYIDDEIIVINKPTGVLTHSKGVMSDEFTVADFFRRYSTVGLETNRPGIVHRLDRDTSGVLIGARTPESALLLKKQFAQRTAKKQYIAVVDGSPKHGSAMIDLPIGRNPSAPSTFRVDPSGKSALTSYEVLRTDGRRSLVRLTPKTGRTHQLRVHMQYIGTPIVGDRVYGVTKKADRMYLHAESLEITIPHSKRQTFTAPLPDDFGALVG